VDLASLVAVDLALLVAVECSLSPLTIWLRWEQAGSGGMLTLTCLTIWLRWEQAVSGGSGFAGSSGMLALTSDDLPSQGASC